MKQTKSIKFTYEDINKPTTTKNTNEDEIWLVLRGSVLLIKRDSKMRTSTGLLHGRFHNTKIVKYKRRVAHRMEIDNTLMLSEEVICEKSSCTEAPALLLSNSSVNPRARTVEPTYSETASETDFVYMHRETWSFPYMKTKSQSQKYQMKINSWKIFLQ